MAAGPWIPVNTVREKIWRGQFDFDGDLFRVALLQSTSNISAASTTYAGLTNEVAAGNGYVTGGVAVSFAFAGTTVATLKFVTNPSWAASGGNIVGRFAVLYEVGGDVIAYCLPDATPADFTVVSGSVFTVNGIANAVLTMA